MIQKTWKPFDDGIMNVLEHWIGSTEGNEAILRRPSSLTDSCPSGFNIRKLEP